jgi:tRNA-splicing ligase RtcB (3'-phosphate/5'-hydroxy nucleic acid ligase)
MERIGQSIVTFCPWQEIEAEAQKQISNTAKLPFLYKWVAVMPDCHFGKGATVGTVMATRGAVVPAAVGVDIGCGMIALQTSLQRGELKDLKALRQGIERRIPMSAGRNNSKVTETAARRIAELRREEAESGAQYRAFDSEWPLALGTLGGGNHFIEVCLDEHDRVWLTVHSGSRGVGNKIGNHYIRQAQKQCLAAGVDLPDRDLAFLRQGTRAFEDYLRDLHWAQTFAKLNRDEMMDRLLEELSDHIYGEQGHQRELEVLRINCHHNFTHVETHFGEQVWVTRKGAIEARAGMRGMIPGSMGTRSYIVSGLGNALAFQSAPHGAGRRMSRTKAKQAFTLADLDEIMAGIEFRRSAVLIDEIPSAYKDIDQVMENAKELVKIEHTLKQVVNCKGD